MMERQFFDLFLKSWFLLSAIVFLVLLFVRAPYGRHNRAGWGPQMPSRLGWMVMEGVSAALMAVFFLASDRRLGTAAKIFFFLWEVHYVHRAFIYPFRRRDEGRTMPVLIVAFGVLFNVGNCYLNGRYLFAFGPSYDAGWLTDPRFLAGILIFALGFGINRHSDRILSHLRRPGETGYKIPRGGLFEWVSCPNYLGEILEWSGWALATWSLPGLSFAIWTAANLVPRALAHHRWYREKFSDYPPKRKAVVPFLL